MFFPQRIDLVSILRVDLYYNPVRYPSPLWSSASSFSFCFAKSHIRWLHPACRKKVLVHSIRAFSLFVSSTIVQDACHLIDSRLLFVYIRTFVSRHLFQLQIQANTTGKGDHIGIYYNRESMITSERTETLKATTSCRLNQRSKNPIMAREPLVRAQEVHIPPVRLP